MQKIIYPLEQVLQVKQKRVEEAEKVVKEKQQILEKEQKILKEREAARDKVKAHRQDKLTQLRATMDEGTTSPKIQQMKAYLKIVEENFQIEEKKVKEQQEKVKTAEKHLEEARNDLKRKRQEVDKLVLHKTDWTKEKRRENEIQEGRDQDELGSMIHGIRSSR